MVNTIDATPTTIYTLAPPPGKIFYFSYEIIPNLAYAGINPNLAPGAFRRRGVIGRIGSAVPVGTVFEDVTNAPNGLGTQIANVWTDAYPTNSYSAAAFNGSVYLVLSGNTALLTVQGFPTPASWQASNVYANTLSVSTTSNVGGDVQITTTSPHGLATGQQLSIEGIVGTTEANGFWESITVTGATTFTIPQTFSHAYSSGGTVTIPSIIVNSGGGYYLLTTPGTSGSVSGPTGTGINIADNTCEWAYIGPAAGGVPIQWTMYLTLEQG
jgi:hypothetical protein